MIDQVKLGQVRIFASRNLSFLNTAESVQISSHPFLPLRSEEPQQHRYYLLQQYLELFHHQVSVTSFHADLTYIIKLNHRYVNILELACLSGGGILHIDLLSMEASIREGRCLLPIIYGEFVENLCKELTTSHQEVLVYSLRLEV